MIPNRQPNFFRMDSLQKKDRRAVVSWIYASGKMKTPCPRSLRNSKNQNEQGCNLFRNLLFGFLFFSNGRYGAESKAQVDFIGDLKHNILVGDFYHRPV